MNKIKLALLLTAFAVLTQSCGEQKPTEVQATDNTQTEQGFVKDIDAAEFKKLADAGNGIILDVRTPGEIAESHIANSSAINIYDEDFEEKINLMDKTKEIYVYCKGGGRSAEAAQILKKNGFSKVYNLDGGIMSWERNGYPTEQGEAAEDENIKALSLAEFNEILNTDKPVLVDFHTQWCSPCRKMAPVVDEIQKEYEGKAVVLRVDVDKSKEIGEKYEIQGVPVFMVFKNGKAQWTHNGTIAKEGLTTEVDKAI